jgi:hypothetical protein
MAVIFVDISLLCDGAGHSLDDWYIMTIDIMILPIDTSMSLNSWNRKKLQRYIQPWLGRSCGALKFIFLWSDCGKLGWW